MLRRTFLKAMGAAFAGTLLPAPVLTKVPQAYKIIVESEMIAPTVIKMTPKIVPVGVPAYTFASDLGTGMYRVGDIVRFSCGTTEFKGDFKITKLDIKTDVLG